MEQKLHTLCLGETGIIYALRDSGISGRLRDLGFTEGSPVTCVRVSPLGDPLAFRIRGALIALRKKDAALVEIRPIPADAAGEGRHP
ncbi:MAG: ferrous iron transport protein A [Clostridia bacterium]|nr:ferrous iron transport protein A [Clostridia bacterium]